MRKHIWSTAVLLVMVILAFGSLNTDKSANQNAPNSKPSAGDDTGGNNAVGEKGMKGNEKIIHYEILSTKQRGDAKLIIDILVSEAASKGDVMKLADSLHRVYAGKYAFIHIYDSRETWRRWNDDSYPDKERDRHFLVLMDGGVTGGKAEIRWAAEGRGH